MSSQSELLRDVVDRLGYADAVGFVEKTTDPGARDFIWQDLRDKCGVDAAYFQGAVPVVAFAATQTREAALSTHRRLWNYGRVPVLIVTTNDEVLALSCATTGTVRDPEAAVLVQASDRADLGAVFDDFTRFSVESGRLAGRYGDRLTKTNRVDIALLRNLRQLKRQLVGAGALETEIEPLLGRSIFVKYLEDRHILRPEDLRALGQPDSLVAALDDGWDSALSFFGAMSEHFSGDVFRGGTLERPIPQAALSVLGDFFRATDLQSGQGSLWPYDFSIIPPELISSIYEQLLIDKQKDDAAYYTPRRVVDLVLDETLPTNWETVPAPTILDPACGSGIFLTEAFRRIVYHRMAARGGQKLDFEELQRTLVESIFGVDLNADAVGVTAFGLYLALLEHVDPRTIWLTVRLPALIGTNLVVSDFFDTNRFTGRRFDLVVGNPPWQSRLSPAASRYLAETNKTAPDRQVAVAFMWKALDVLREGGTVGFVLPAKTFLHNRVGSADRFRLALFDTTHVRTIVDLSPLRRELFGNATNPAAVVVYTHRTPETADQPILHVSPRRTPVAQFVDGIAIPQQNIRHVPQSVAATDPSIWKPLLWGTPEDASLVQHLRETFTPLSELIRKSGWSDGAGYQIVKNGATLDASHLADIKRIETNKFRPMRPPAILAEPVDVETMHRPRKLGIYLAPHVLMRKGFKEFPEAAFIGFDATFTDGLSAIAGPDQDKPRLQAVAAILNSSVARYWFLMTASSWGVEREQLHHREWLSLPMPPMDDDTVANLANIVDKAAQGAPEMEWRDNLDEVVRGAYRLNDWEEVTVIDALSVRWSEQHFGWRSDAYNPPDADEFATYARSLGTHLDALDIGAWHISLSERAHGLARVTCQCVDPRDTTADNPNTPAADGTSTAPGFVIARLLTNPAPHRDEWLTTATIIEPRAVVLDGNAVHLLKPDRLTCWTAGSARTDATEVFTALVDGEVLDPAAADA